MLSPNDPRRHALKAFGGVLAIAFGFASWFALTSPGTSPPSEAFSFGDAAQSATRSTPSAPPWIDSALCDENCEALLTMGGLLDTLERLEAEIDAAPNQRDRLIGLPYSICPRDCPDRFLTLAQVELVLWRWLGSPGWPLIGSGVIGSDEAMARAFFSRAAPATHLACEQHCGARRSDLRRAVAVLHEEGYLKGLRPGSPTPDDLVGAAPFWSAMSWTPVDDLCLDPSGRARYGTFNGTRICVSPELDPELRRDVARHEIAHWWQRWALSYTPIEGVEADADCWASLHGATWMHYEPTGCRDAEHRAGIVNAYAASVGLGS